MPITRRALISAAAAVPAGAAASPLPFVPYGEGMVVASRVRSYAVETRRSRAEVELLLKAFSMPRLGKATTSGFGSIVDRDAAFCPSTYKELLSLVGMPDEIMDVRLEGAVGECASAFSGREVPYLKSFELAGRECRNEVFDTFKVGLRLEVRPSLEPDGRVHVVVGHMVTGIDGELQVSDSLPRLCQSTGLFAASLETGQTALYADFGTHASPLGADVVTVTLITPEAVV